MGWRSSHAAVVAMLSACSFGVTSAGVQCQVDTTLDNGGALACSQTLTDLTVTRGPSVGTNHPFRNLTFESRWSESLDPLPSGTASNTSSVDRSSALGSVSAPNATSVWGERASVPAELGINYALSPNAGEIDHGSGVGNVTVGGTGGSIAFLVGYSFGLMADFITASVDGREFDQGGKNLYSRDLGLGLQGGGAHLGQFRNFGGANFAYSGATLDTYVGRFTPFETVGAFGAQGLLKRENRNIGPAYYPADNLQLAVSTQDDGGFNGVPDCQSGTLIPVHRFGCGSQFPVLPK